MGKRETDLTVRHEPMRIAGRKVEADGLELVAISQMHWAQIWA